MRGGIGTADFSKMRRGIVDFGEGEAPLAFFLAFVSSVKHCFIDKQPQSSN